MALQVCFFYYYLLCNYNYASHNIITTDAPDDYVAVRRGFIEFNTGDTSQTHIIFINPDDICEDGSLEKFYSNIVLEIGQQVRVSPPRAIVYIDDSQEPECGKI